MHAGLAPHRMATHPHLLSPGTLTAKARAAVDDKAKPRPKGRGWPWRCRGVGAAPARGWGESPTLGIELGAEDAGAKLQRASGGRGRRFRSGRFDISRRHAPADVIYSVQMQKRERTAGVRERKLSPGCTAPISVRRVGVTTRGDAFVFGPHAGSISAGSARRCERLASTGSRGLARADWLGSSGSTQAPRFEPVSSSKAKNES